jgi:hypothetical protein
MHKVASLIQQNNIVAIGTFIMLFFIALVNTCSGNEEQTSSSLINNSKSMYTTMLYLLHISFIGFLFFLKKTGTHITPVILALLCSSFVFLFCFSLYLDPEVRADRGNVIIALYFAITGISSLAIFNKRY